MKKLAVLGSGRADNFEAIVKYIEKKDVEITCISDSLKSDIFQKAQTLGIKHEYLLPEEYPGFLGAEDFNLIALTDYENELSEEVLDAGRFVNVHPSLLPAFKGKDAISRAFLAGVKVSGVTVHTLSNEPDGGKILAQYPVLIGQETHFDEFRSDIYALENYLYPRVIEAVLNDKIFDSSTLFHAQCSEISCGGCGNCK